MVVRLKENILIREERDGGKCFDILTGNIIKVNFKLFQMLHKIKTLGIYGIPPYFKDEKLLKMINELKKLNIIEEVPIGILNDDYFLRLKDYVELKPNLNLVSAPETVHYAVTFRCQKNCIDCYMKKNQNQYCKEMSIDEITRVFKKIKDANVFQLAIGGGEPFLKENLKDILRIATDFNLVVHITTGKYDLNEKEINMVKKYVKVLQLGICVTKDGQIENLSKLSVLIKKLKKEHILFGANFILNHTGIIYLEKIVSSLCALGFPSVTFVRYKPPLSEKRWKEEVPSYNDWIHLEIALKDLKDTDMSFRFDCALSFLGRNNIDIACKNGYEGCTAGKNIVAMTPDGSIFPCSQLVGKEFWAGNLITDSFEDIYSHKVLRKYQQFRNTKSFKFSTCGNCKYSQYCGGCRVLAQDAYNEEVMCYDPIFKKKDRSLWNDYLEVADVVGETSNGIFYYTFEQYMNDCLTQYPYWIRKKVKYENTICKKRI